MKEKNFKVLHILILFIISTIFAVSIYILNDLSSTNFEEIVFASFSSIGNSDFRTIIPGLKMCVPIILFLTTIFYVLFYDITNNKSKTKNYPIKHLMKHRKLYTLILLILALFMLCYSVHFFNYIINLNTSSSFIENHYVDPKETTVSFSEKRNLIFIFVESLENTLFTKDQGGMWEYEVIPELYELRNDKDSISFEPTKGLKMLHGSSWTSASVVANNTGVPFKVLPNKDAYTKKIMCGSYSLGNLLKSNGYYNEVISSANTTFGNLNQFYKKNGNYEIIDIDSLKNYGLTLSEKDKGNWGFNDNYLFNVARERLDVLSKMNEPFNLQLLTVDTHFFDGFVSDYSETKFESQYENSYATESKLINEFVSWVKEQSFYDNTTIVIMGDHLAMQSNFINDTMFNNRSVYYCLINPYNKNKISSNRVFTALDTYPTIVSAIGGKIEGEKLGLGVNLFSGEKTLVEEYGLEKLDKELQKKSEFYNKKILNIK